jgi:hypothetical protein
MIRNIRTKLNYPHDIPLADGGDFPPGTRESRSAGMRHRDSNSQARATGQKRKRSSRGVANTRNSYRSTRSSRQLSSRQRNARVRAFAAINLVRRGKAKNLSSAARAEHTTVKAVRELLPSALVQESPGRRIRVKASDRYSARVQITTTSGPLDVTAHGSRERELAGRHRAVLIKVQRNDLPPSALEQFRGQAVGGQELLTDLEQLSIQGQAGVLPQLDSLYVNPETSV